MRVQLHPGELITSQSHLAEAANTTRQVVRDTLTALIRLGTIGTKIRTKRYTQISVVNWDIYQGEEFDENQDENRKRTKREPSENHSGRRKEGEKERKELPCEAPASRNGHEALNILEWLNRKSSRNYRPCDTNLILIKQRLRDGIADWQLKAIVSLKCEQWAGTEMEKYLRPATLFNKTKCEQYLGELPREDANGLSTLRPGTA
jgi:uncharacterized phage protein (TIGR02220 family)